MKKVAVIVLALAIVMLASAVAPAMALGPVNNPYAESDPGAVFLSTGGGQVVIEFVQAGRINVVQDAKPNYKGIMNNVILVVGSLVTFQYLGQHYTEFMNMPRWVYLSGEKTEGGTFVIIPPEGAHGAWYWTLRLAHNIPPAEALATANESPYGIYMRGHNLGWSTMG